MEYKIAAVVALLVMLPYHGEAAEHTVGDSKQWSFDVNYTTWASARTFLVGDTLVFKYTSPVHNVLEVSKAAYESCQASNPRQIHSGGSTNITLTNAGKEYFMCGTPGHCAAGMKLAITIAAANSPSPIATPAAPSPSTDTAPEPTSAGHVTQIKDMAVLLVGSVLVSVMLMLV